jgi:hypothetical protein
VRPLAPCITTLFLAVHSSTGQFQREAASAISIMRAWAPA